MILHTYSITNNTTNDLGLISVLQALLACIYLKKYLLERRGGISCGKACIVVDGLIHMINFFSLPVECMNSYNV
jgi:hypothetical protein